MHRNISRVCAHFWGVGCNVASFWPERPGMQPTPQKCAQTARRGSPPKCVQMTFFAKKKKKRKLQSCQKEFCGLPSHPLPTFGGFGVWLSMRGPSHPPWKRPSHTYQHRRIGSDCRTVWMYSTENRIILRSSFTSRLKFVYVQRWGSFSLNDIRVAAPSGSTATSLGLTTVAPVGTT